ncbi:selenocysteine lyase/cysteine desulfurase [Saccharopolyspora lacisalsi]|uniref:Selenocysteine lyase/cysteine desulfurase n=1 Tax=Halosaccharopolyspora lacisalsi TaxID=1000566 RepID=A0A839DX83_9PSEU|nr:aminotransferase class V-fold PLP-dependent enzyme [Halosaccharopolyspora lacisalsi]MBA8823348.1 selenocysteine lyase/cysteine desulfurase [Halosaccharopolyspora lacisalsi]
MREAFGETFDVEPGYLNTASIGVPPASAAVAVAEAVSRWSRGLDTAADFDASVASARAAFADLVGVPSERIASGATVSQLVGLVAAGVPDGSRVLVAENEFTSVTFPFAAQADRGVRVAEAELTELAERAGEYDVVAVSAVQSGDGRVVDLDGLRRAARTHGTRVLLDVSQAAGWMPLRLDWADWVVGAAYKWLLSPRGAAWLAVHPDTAELRPNSANWYAGEHPWDSIYGLPLRLAGNARALDLSPVWFAQVGASVAMSRLAGLDMTEVHGHCVGLADAFRAALGMPAAGSAIVAVDAPDAVSRLAEAGVRCSARAGRARLAFHLHNTADDVDTAVRAVRTA